MVTVATYPAVATIKGNALVSHQVCVLVMVVASITDVAIAIATITVAASINT